MRDLWFPILQCRIPIKCHGKVFWGIVVSHAGTELRLQYASPRGHILSWSVWVVLDYNLEVVLWSELQWGALRMTLIFPAGNKR